MTIGGRNTEAIIRQVNTNLNNNRKNYCTALHLITGHCGLNKYLSTYTGSTGPPLTSSSLQDRRDSLTLSRQLPRNSRTEKQHFHYYYLDVNYMFNKYTIINYTNLANRFNILEDSDQT
jgi:hypothetical protein